MKMKLPTSLASWVTLVSAQLMVLVALYQAVRFGSVEDAIVQTLLLNAGLFLGLQNAKSVAVQMNAKRQETKVAVAQATKDQPQVNVTKAEVVDVNSGM